MRLWADRDDEIEVVWFRVREDAEWLGGDTPFRSANWNSGRNAHHLGEVEGAPRTWTDGQAPAAYFGKSFCGSMDAWEQGGREGIDPEIETGPDGYSNCCGLALGRVGPQLRFGVEGFRPANGAGVRLRLSARQLPPAAPRGPLALAPDPSSPQGGAIAGQPGAALLVQLRGAQTPELMGEGLPLLLRLRSAQGREIGTGPAPLAIVNTGRPASGIPSGPLRLAVEPSTVPSIYPTVRSIATVPTSGAGSITVSKPAGTVAGDILFFWNISNTSTTPTVSPPAGWSLAYAATIISGLRYAFCYHKTAGGSEPASYTWSSTGTGSNTGGILCVKDSTGIGELGPYGTTTGTTLTPTAPACVLSHGAGSLVVYFLVGHGTGTIATDPTGFALEARAVSLTTQVDAWSLTNYGGGTPGAAVATFNTTIRPGAAQVVFSP